MGILRPGAGEDAAPECRVLSQAGQLAVSLAGVAAVVVLVALLKNP